MRKIQAALAGIAIILLAANICVYFIIDHPYKGNPGSIFTSLVESVGGE